MYVLITSSHLVHQFIHTEQKRNKNRMGRPPCCDKVGIKKGPWTPEEDIILVSYIQEHGPGNWRAVPTNTGLMRCSKSCRLRWTNYLRPGIKRGNFTPHEEGMIIHLQAMLGNKWAAIATYLPQRTDNDIKNYWNTHLKKKLKKFQSNGGGSEPRHNKIASDSNNPSHHQFIYGTVAKNDKHQTRVSSLYASSEENISRLLEGWMRSSPSPLPLNTATDLVPAVSRGHEFGKNPIQCISTPQISTNDRMIMISHHHHDHELESILSFDHSHGLIASCHDQKSSCDSSKGSESSGGGLMMDHDCPQFDQKPPKLDAAAGNPPLSFLEKWLLDESAGQVEGVMELPPIF